MPAERSERMIYLRALGPLVLAILTLVIVSVGGFHALSASRAYVGAESLWSKSRSQAVAVLRARIGPWQPAPDCSHFDDFLGVPLGARGARLELDKATPDFDLARAGFLRAGNPPDDVEGMIHLYLNFRSTPQMQEAIAAWRQGDALIEQLQALGRRVCEQSSGPQHAEQIATLLRELDALEAALIATEKRFSATLSRWSRTTESWLTAATVLLALLLASAGAWFVVRSLRAQLDQQRQLTEANKRWELAAEAAAIGVFVWQPSDDSLEFDARAKTLHGLAADTAAVIRGADTLALVHPDDRAMVERQWQIAVPGSELLKSRYRIIRPDGSLRHLEATGMMRPAGVHGAARMIGVIHDISDEVSKAQLRIEKEAAERVALSRTEFLSRLSHELRTPLNAVLGLAQLLEMDTTDPLSARQRERMKLVLDSGWHLLHLVDDVLDITSIDSGMLATQSASIDLPGVIQASLNLIEPERKSFGIVVQNLLPADPPKVLGDSRRLQQVFVNLLSNACKYNTRGGTLTLRCDDEPGFFCVRVEDEGRGMNTAQLAELFQPFKRLQVSPDVPGTGLGLVVVKRLVGQMGGSIDVSSEPGRGTCFTVRLRKA